MELCIDTSTRYASVAISEDGVIARETTWRSGQNHSVELVPTLRSLLQSAGADIAQVGAIFVARGPGGFSALRVGMSVAKSLAGARSIPIVGVGTLDIEADVYLGLGMPVCAVIEAGRTMVYTAKYSPASDTAETPADGYEALTHDEFLERAQAATLYCGEGVCAVEKGLREKLGKTALLSTAPPPTRSPAGIARLGYHSLRVGRTDSPDSLQPLYIRGSQFDAARRALGAGAREVR